MSITTKKAIFGVLALIGAVLCAQALQMSTTDNPENWIMLWTGKTFCFAFIFFWISAMIDIFKMNRRMHRK